MQTMKLEKRSKVHQFFYGPQKITYCLTLIIMLSLLGCNREAGDWERTKKENSKSAYSSFVGKYPQSQNIAEAKKQILKFETEENWQKACSDNTVASYIEFEKNYPESQMSKQVDDKIKSLIDPKDAELAKYENLKNKQIYYNLKDFIDRIKNPAIKYLGDKELAKYKKLQADSDMLVTISDLKEKYKWNGKLEIWAWHPTKDVIAFAGPSGGGGFITNTTEKKGAKISFGSNHTFTGAFCLGNLPFSGSCINEANGLKLLKGTTMYYRLD